MHESTFTFSLFLIFFGATVLSTLALWTRQSMLVAYILLGILLGPWGLKLIADATMVQHIGDIGIIFLLFLLGLHLPPQKLVGMLKKITWVGILSSLAFAGIGFAISRLFSFSTIDSYIIATAMIFSSTIIGIKLLPTTILHHQHTGEVMISVLLFQDIIAIAALLILNGVSVKGHIYKDILMVVLGLPAILLLVYTCERFLLRRLLKKFSRVKEYLFLFAIAWCLTLVVIASRMGLSDEIGAFIAGVSLASSPIALYIAESLKPVRDFFLIMFFFSVGAGFNWHFLPQVLAPALLLASVLFFAKPYIYMFLLKQVGENKAVALEVGFRLGQISEFSLLIAYVAQSSHLLSAPGAYLIQGATILSFVVSSYYVVMKYPTPVATCDRLRRD